MKLCYKILLVIMFFPALHSGQKLTGEKSESEKSDLENYILYYLTGYYSVWEAEKAVSAADNTQGACLRYTGGETSDGGWMINAGSNNQHGVDLFGPCYPQDFVFDQKIFYDPYITYKLFVKLNFDNLPVVPEEVMTIRGVYRYRDVMQKTDYEYEIFSASLNTANIPEGISFDWQSPAFNYRGLSDSLMKRGITVNDKILLSKNRHETYWSSDSGNMPFNDIQNGYGFSVEFDYIGDTTEVEIGRIEICDSGVGAALRENYDQIEQIIEDELQNSAVDGIYPEFSIPSADTVFIDRKLPFIILNSILKDARSR